jgi:hypothetical protein
VSVLRGPLNQRASVVQSNVRYDTSGIMSLAVAQQLPTGYTGVRDDGRVRNRTITSLTPTFAEIMQEYSLRSNITMDTEASSCGESCSTTIRVRTMKLYISQRLKANVQLRVKSFATLAPNLSPTITTTTTTTHYNYVNTACFWT